MSRKSLILCISALAVLLLGLGVAIAFLYSGTGNDKGKSGAASFDGARSCLAAVPSDAVLVSCFENIGTACKGVLSVFDLPSSLAARIADGSLASLRKCSMAVSLHYAGKIHPLYVIDLRRASDATVVELEAFVRDSGMHSSRVEDFIAVSGSETLVRSAVRHCEKNVSIADAPGFEDALEMVEGGDVVLVSNLHVQKLMSSMFASSVSKHSSFVERLSDWMAFNVAAESGLPVSMDGAMLYEGEPDEFMTALEGCRPSVSEVGKVLPSYTLSVVSLPFRNMTEYIGAYQSFMDSRQALQNFKEVQKKLTASAGISPEELFKLLDVRELASATFVLGSKVEKVNLIRSGCKDAGLIFKGSDVKSLRDCGTHAWTYQSFISSVFGKFFALSDESCCTYIDGWIITGSKEAVEAFASDTFLEYTLEEYLADAGRASLLSEKPSVLTAYYSLTEDKDRLNSSLKSDISGLISGMTSGCDCAPALFTLTKDKKGICASFDIHTLTLQKTKAPTHERDTVVVVPAGPFKVKNSHTGKMNTFYQNAQNAICLRDETGKDLWGVPLGMPICGTAHNVDYYANGKLQIIFGAGSSIYIIDRLGRYVNGFPLDLGRKITLGPDIYDFSGARRYNVMVLHNDNTVQMYNLKGKKPDAWKGITVADETIKALPERLTVGGKDFWIVRTSIQTLIFPFYGGNPLTVFEGDSKIRPDSPVTAVDGTSVQAESYDGKTRTIRLIK